VVENVERNLSLGLSPREAAHKTMDEVGGALIAIALTLCAVFIPSAFIPVFRGSFFSAVRRDDHGFHTDLVLRFMTLSPALCGVLLRPHETHHAYQRHFLLARLVLGFFSTFNRSFEWLSQRFGRLTGA